MRIKFVYIFQLLMMSLLTSCTGNAKAPREVQYEALPDSILEYKVLYVEDVPSEQAAEIVASSLGGGNEEVETAIRGMFRTRHMLHADSAGGAARPVPYAFRKVTYTYSSTDQHGRPVTLSAVVCWERHLQSLGQEVQPEGIALIHHYTIASDAECPTQGLTAEAFLFPRMLTVLPDYIGYGASRGHLHPYLNHRVSAVNSIDALGAAMKIFGEHSAAGMKEGWTTCSYGASQGGGNALAVHRYMDTHPELASKWRFASSHCAAGPYSPSLTMNEYISRDTIGYPVVLPMTLKSMLDSYPQSMLHREERDFYSSQYLGIKDSVDVMLASKEYTAGQINKVIAEYFGGEGATEVSVRDVLSKEALDAESELSQALHACFLHNDLTQGWRPVHKIYLYHSDGDEVVPSVNADALLEAMGCENVAFEKSTLNEGHSESCARWMLQRLMSKNYHKE